MRLIRSAVELKALLADHASTHPCSCSPGRCASWESLSEDRWPANQMQAVAALRDPELDEPTCEEHHPQGTRYDSPDAPVALKYFPYNRCELWRCQRHLLGHTEFGGCYVDHRVRELSPQLDIID